MKTLCLGFSPAMFWISQAVALQTWIGRRHIRNLARLLLCAPIFGFPSSGSATTVISCAGLPYLGEPIDAATTCLSFTSGGDAFNGLLRTGSRNIGVVLLHGRNVFLEGSPWRNNPNGPVVSELRTHLNDLGFTTLSIETPNVAPVDDANSNDRADFGEYEANEPAFTAQTFARINASISELGGLGIKEIILAGFSMGSRYATAATAAADQGVLGNSLDIVGLIGVGMASGIGISDPTTGPNDIHGYGSLTNLPLITSIPTLDIFGDQDPGVAGSFAADRLAAYGGNPNDYTQASITCPDFQNTTYYFRRDGAITTANLYTGNRCHQLLDGYLQGTNPDTFLLDVDVSGSANSPFETVVTAWVSEQFAVPEPGSLVLFITGFLIINVSTFGSFKEKGVGV